MNPSTNRQLNTTRLFQFPSSMTPIVLAIGLLGPSSPVDSTTIDPNGSGRRFAYQENTGWRNAKPLGTDGPGVSIYHTAVTGWIWSETIGWISLSCENTQSCADVDYAVVHDGMGHLSGLAWSENAGWVSFSCRNTSSCSRVDYGVSIDPVSGDFRGFAWAENIGWVSFSCSNTASCAVVDYGVTTQVPFPSPVVFADGFESGTLDAWSTIHNGS